MLHLIRYLLQFVLNLQLFWGKFSLVLQKPRKSKIPAVVSETKMYYCGLYHIDHKKSSFFTAFRVKNTV